jgi:hypothetical protein
MDFVPKIKFGISLRRVLDLSLLSWKCTQNGAVPPSPLLLHNLWNHDVSGKFLARFGCQRT